MFILGDVLPTFSSGERSVKKSYTKMNRLKSGMQRFEFAASLNKDIGCIFHDRIPGIAITVKWSTCLLGKVLPTFSRGARSVNETCTNMKWLISGSRLKIWQLWEWK
jgi:hypothetical protein